MLSSDHIDHHVRATSSLDAPVSISTATATPEPTVEGLVMWLIRRCERRRDTAEPHDRRRLYEERVTILCSLVRAAAVDSALTLSPCTMQLAVEILQLKNLMETWMKQWKPDLTWSVHIWVQNNVKFRTRIFGLCYNMGRDPNLRNPPKIYTWNFSSSIATSAVRREWEA